MQFPVSTIHQWRRVIDVLVEKSNCCIDIRQHLYLQTKWGVGKRTLIRFRRHVWETSQCILKVLKHFTKSGQGQPLNPKILFLL